MVAVIVIPCTSGPTTGELGASRIAQSGDYYGQQPAILGSERTGPDLSQEGGEHPDDWHMAHFINPRYTSPLSLMPSWEFLGAEKIKKLTAYVQYLGLKQADVRVARQNYWKKEAIKAFESGPDSNIQWLHSKVPRVWREMPNPYPATEDALLQGKKHIPGILYWLSRTGGRWRRPGSKIPLSAAT